MAEETKNQTVNLNLPKSVLARSEDQIRVKADKFQQLYANNIQIGFSSFDMALAFGQIVGEEEGKVIVEEVARILLPRELGKVLAGLLLANIQAYEQQFGEIKIPTPLLSNADETEPEEQTIAPEQLMTQAVKKSGQRSK